MFGTYNVFNWLVLSYVKLWILYSPLSVSIPPVILLPVLPVPPLPVPVLPVPVLLQILLDHQLVVTPHAIIMPIIIKINIT